MSERTRESNSFVFLWVFRVVIVVFDLKRFKQVIGKQELSTRFEVGGDILKVDGTFHVTYFFFLKRFCNDHCFFLYFRQFPATKNVPIASDIASRRCLLTTLVYL